MFTAFEFLVTWPEKWYLVRKFRNLCDAAQQDKLSKFCAQ
jgi:hypothetical protein